MLKEELILFNQKHGGDLIGFASADRFEGAPRGHHPRDFITQGKTVISVGMVVPRQVLNYENLLENSELIPPEIREEYLQKYFYRACGYANINEMLDTLAYKITRYLEKSGYKAIFFTATYGTKYGDIQNMVPGLKGIFSHRHAAVRAGLGEFGLNNLVVTPEHGPRVRFNSIITDVEMPQNPLLDKKACLGIKCKKCVERCGTGAIKYTVNEDELVDAKTWIDPVTTTDVETCRNGRIDAFCLGRCLNVCPVGE